MSTTISTTHDSIFDTACSYDISCKDSKNKWLSQSIAKSCQNRQRKNNQKSKTTKSNCYDFSHLKERVRNEQFINAIIKDNNDKFQDELESISSLIIDKSLMVLASSKRRHRKRNSKKNKKYLYSNNTVIQIDINADSLSENKKTKKKIKNPKRKIKQRKQKIKMKIKKPKQKKNTINITNNTINNTNNHNNSYIENGFNNTLSSDETRKTKNKIIKPRKIETNSIPPPRHTNKTFFSSFKWGFNVSTTMEAQNAVDWNDKEHAIKQNAKTNFGELTENGVTKALNNLGVHKKHVKIFYDLGTGSGKVPLQAYLKFNNLTKCIGIEITKGRYLFAEYNFKNLLRFGYKNRKFLQIEYKKEKYFKIVELTENKNPKNNWKIGDKCIAYCDTLKKLYCLENINYLGIIYDINEINETNNKTFTIKYLNPKYGTKILNNCQYLFIPNTERTCEIWNGSLFDYPNGIKDADICNIAVDFPQCMNEKLIKFMEDTKIGCTFLTYHNIQYWECFNVESKKLEKLYYNDRYDVSWTSYGFPFYLWKRIGDVTDVNDDLKKIILPNLIRNKSK